MNEPESNLTSRSVDNGETCADLRRQINVLFGVLVVTSFVLTAYLGLEARRASAELIAVKPQAEQAEKLIAQDNAAVQAIFSKLQEFGRAHPDFQARILSKYKVNGPATNAAPKK